MSETTAAPTPTPRRRSTDDVPITFGLILRWSAPIVAVLVALTGGVASYVSLEARVRQLEQSTAGDHELLLKIDRKLALLVCKDNPARCGDEPQ